MHRPRVLLVEDEFLIRMTLADALMDDGFDVVEADNGDAALAFVVGPDGIALLVTDLQLPGGLTGLELALACRRYDPDLPILFMTGRPDLVSGSLRPVNSAVVGKPYLPSEICQAARKLLAGD